MSDAFIQQKPRVDTRGLPIGYDPHYFYEYASSQRSKEADGLEGLLYKIIPLNLIRSFAFAIDPFKQFKTATGIVSPISRSREFIKDSVLNGNHWVKHTVTQSFGCRYEPNGEVSPTDYGPLTDTVTKGNLTASRLSYCRIKDTTKRTRLPGSGVGELELFKSTVSAPSRSVFQVTNNVSVYYGANGTSGKSGNTKYISGEDSSASWFTKNQVATLRDDVIAKSNLYMAEHAVAMYKGITPFSRNYSLFRNIVELRDLPRSISSFRETAKHLSQFYSGLPQGLARTLFDSKTLLKDIPNEYLSFVFGWRQTLSDLHGLVSTPEKIAKQVNFLLARNGKDTTYRSQKSFTTAVDGVTGLTYDNWGTDTSITSKSRDQRTYTMKMVVNTKFSFPPIDEPILRKAFFWKKFGTYPTPTDIYNLVPWSWMVDWFTGLGNYVELIDNLTRDPQLINWGFLTCVCDGSVSTQYKSRTPQHEGFAIYPYGGTKIDTSRDYYTDNSHTSVVDFKSQVRKSLANVMDVNMTTDDRTLTAYQKSIIGALLSQRSPYWRGH